MTVTSVLQTSAGRMIFGRYHDAGIAGVVMPMPCVVRLNNDEQSILPNRTASSLKAAVGLAVQRTRFTHIGRRFVHNERSRHGNEKFEDATMNTNPFPGMNPFLESHWGDVHTSLTTYARDHLQPQLPSGLRARIEEYVAVESDWVTGAIKRSRFAPDVRVIERSASAGRIGSP